MTSIAANVEHRFYDIIEELIVLVFAPAESYLCALAMDHQISPMCPKTGPPFERSIVRYCHG